MGKMLGGGGKVKPHVQAALDAAREKARRAAIVPVEDSAKIKAAGVKSQRAKARGRQSTLLSRAGSDETLGA